MDETTAKRLFDAIRKVKGSSLTQADVNLINAALVADLAVIAKAGMRTSPAGIALIHSFEQLKLTSYPDPGSKDGKPVTCGWGTTVDENGKPIPLGVTWTKEKADRLFERDLAAMEAAVNFLIGDKPTTQAQFDALVSFAYNVGPDIDDDDKAEGLGDSTLLKQHLAGRYDAAAKSFLNWVYNDGKKLNGLVRRREAEKAMYEGKA